MQSIYYFCSCAASNKLLRVLKPQSCPTSSLIEANLKQIWPLCEAALSAECFLIPQSPTQSHKGSRGIHLGFSRPGQPCRSSTPHPQCAPLCQAEVFPGRDPDLAPVHPGLRSQLFWNHHLSQSTFLSCVCICLFPAQASLFGGF